MYCRDTYWHRWIYCDCCDEPVRFCYSIEGDFGDYCNYDCADYAEGDPYYDGYYYYGSYDYDYYDRYDF